ncbi:MAG: hypothetical protein WC479_04575 [Candidatus Izemoplasmatales bacterium]
MKPITMIQTYDGAIHTDAESASKHLDKQYGDIILKLTHKICDIVFEQGHPITLVSDYIDANLNEFEKLRVIKNDMEYIKNEETEEC